MGSLHGQGAAPPTTPSLIKGLPYTAIQWTTTAIRLADGTDRATVRELVVARSTDGVVRREAHTSSDGRDKNPNMPTTAILILDAERSSAIYLSPDRHTATVMAQPNVKAPKAQGTQTSSAPSTMKTSTANLGNATIDGIPAAGRRATYTFMETEAGAQQTVTATTDTWFSTDLHIILKSETYDSKGRSSVVALTGVKRGDPDASLFNIPAGYITATK